MAVNGVNGLNLVSSPTSYGLNKLQEGNNTVSFADYLNNAINQVNDLQVQSEDISNNFAAGKVDNIQDVMIASEKADIALQFTMQIRNKIMDAYSEIMRMQI